MSDRVRVYRQESMHNSLHNGGDMLCLGKKQVPRWRGYRLSGCGREQHALPERFRCPIVRHDKPCRHRLDRAQKQGFG
jgi:hypothetical protein